MTIRSPFRGTNSTMAVPKTAMMIVSTPRPASAP